MSPIHFGRLALGLAIAAAGIGWNYAALALAERWVSRFPSVPDVIVDHLVYVDLYKVGEPFVIAVVAVFLWTFLRARAHDLAYLLALVGVLYAVRGTFLLLLPLGPPLTAPPLETRFSAYPSASHSYFPSGHLGLIAILALMSTARIRPFLWGAAAFFAVGSVLAKAHYVADLLGALIVAYATFAFGERWLRRHFELRRESAPTRPSVT